MKTTNKCLALILGMLPLAAVAGVFSPFSAVYEVTRGDMPLGTAHYSMSTESGNCYLYQGEANPEGLAALLAGKTTEESHFCLRDGKLRTQSYRTSREGGGKNGNYTLSFDWARSEVLTNGQESRKLPADAVDSMALHVALRKIMQDAGNRLPTAPVDLNVVDNDEIKTYSFAVTGREQVKTAIGKMETVRVERINTKKHLRLWLAPSLNYLPVRVETQKRDDPVVRMNIESLPDSPTD